MSDDIDLTSAEDVTPFPVLDGPSEVSRRKFELWQSSSENSLLWDITLVAVDGHRFPASRLELASWSEYFCKIFQGCCPAEVLQTHKASKQTPLVLMSQVTMQRQTRPCSTSQRM